LQERDRDRRVGGAAKTGARARRIHESPRLQISQADRQELQLDRAKLARSNRADRGSAVAVSPSMKTNTLLKWLAGLALIATAAGVLSGCYVETRRPYYHRPIIVVR
jgi:hypothetical protein